MKRCIVLLLILSLLCSSVLPVMATEAQDPNVETLPIVFDPQDMVIRDASDYIPVFSAEGEPAKRDTTEDNLVFPGPLAEKQSIQPNQRQSFTLGTIQTGKQGQYMCLFIYEGKEPKGEPLATVVEPFDTEIGYFTKTMTAYTKDCVPGRYTLVTCTAVERNKTLYPVDGTAFMTDIYSYNDYQTRWQMFLQDSNTKERISTLRLWAEEDVTVLLGRSPLPSDGNGGVYVACDPDLVHIEEAGGYIFLAPKGCGSGILTIVHRSTKAIRVPIYVCTRKGGHFASETYSALEPTVSDKGLTVNVCKECGSVYREETPSLDTVFQGLQDVPADAWYYSSVREAVHRNLFKGVTESAFRPTQSMTRAMLVTVLWRMEACPVVEGDQFTDVPQTAWFAQAVNWAAANGIVNGVGHGKFNPDGRITREQMAAILYRYATILGLDTGADTTIDGFVDGSAVNSWAKDAMNWAITKGLISGIKEGNTIYLRPAGDATRAQVSAILIRFIHTYEAPAPQVTYPDPTAALDSGEWEGLSWAFYEDGSLVIGGEAGIPNDNEFGYYPWATYKEQIKSVELLYGITSVGNYAFSEYPVLETVIMGDSIRDLGEYAFWYCTALTHLVLPDDLKNIKWHCFEGCSSLVTMDLPYGLRSISDRAFAECTALKEMILPDSITGGNPPGGYSAYESSLGNGIFAGCSSLEYVYMPMAERDVPQDMFAGCTSLKEVVLPLCLEKIKSYAFENCVSLENIVIMYNLNSVYEGAFAYCTSLKDVYVFSYEYTIENNTNSTSNTEGDFPFGNPARVTLYGFVGSKTEQTAQRRGYTFVDILSVME